MFNESEHPRNKAGEFTEKGGEGNVSKIEQAENIYNDEPKATEEPTTKKTPAENASVSKKKGKTKDEFFGEEFKGVKGEEAIETLLKEKRGHVKNAFERPEIGGIDLVWGDESGGLGHTIKRRNEQLEQRTGTTSGVDMVRKIPEIIEMGNFKLGAGDRPNFQYQDYLVIIKPAFDGEKVNWVLTAMEPQKPLPDK